jgi:hypothetical protein
VLDTMPFFANLLKPARSKIQFRSGSATPFRYARRLVVHRDFYEFFILFFLQ